MTGPKVVSQCAKESLCLLNLYCSLILLTDKSPRPS
jgi:hypothetical protein